MSVPFFCLIFWLKILIADKMYGNYNTMQKKFSSGLIRMKNLLIKYLFFGTSFKLLHEYKILENSISTSYRRQHHIQHYKKLFNTYYLLFFILLKVLEN